MKTIEGSTRSGRGRYAVVASRFNAFVVDRLLEGAVSGLTEHGVQDEDIVVARVPGAFELPAASRVMADSGQFQAVIALGCVIRGETPHFDFISAECTRGMGQLSLVSDCAVTFGVLTCDSIEQASARAGDKADNKGFEAALSAIEMVDVMGQLQAMGS